MPAPAVKRLLLQGYKSPLTVLFSTLGNGAIAGWTNGAVTGGAFAITPVLLDEIMVNPGFEGTYTAGLAPNCSKTGSPTLAEATGGDVHGGSSAQQITAAAQYDRVVQQPTLTVGTWYFGSIWGKRTAGTAGKEYAEVLYPGTGSARHMALTSATYTQYSAGARATGASSHRFGSMEAGASNFDTAIIDDASCKPVTLASMFSGPTAGMGYVPSSIKATPIGGPNDLAVYHIPWGVALTDDDMSEVVLCYHHGYNCLISNRVAGTWATDPSSVAKTQVTNAPVGMVISGTSVTNRYNNADVATVTIANVTACRYAWLFAMSPLITFSRFEVTP